MESGREYWQKLKAVMDREWSSFVEETREVRVYDRVIILSGAVRQPDSLPDPRPQSPLPGAS